MSDEWSIDKSKLVFGVGRNDLRFLDINEEGELVLVINGHSITFSEIVRRIEQENGNHPRYTSSFTLRIPQLISSQVLRLRAAFENARNELEYNGRFLAVYPVKVNQRYDCVAAVIASDKEYGLEAGTKAELLLIKRIISNEKHRRIVCNGAKDPEYLKMIHECIKEGYNMTISIESLHEASLIIDRFNPDETELVLRLKPYIEVEGHWSHSIGRDSKFGLSVHDLYDVIDLFKRTGFINSVTTILAHVGSQIEDVTSFRRFGRYMTRIFHQLRRMGLENLKIIDFGGGLAIDYTSSNLPDFMETYARMLIEGIKEGLSEVSTEVEPDILIEAGRGITALGSLVIVKALEVRSVFPHRDGLSEEYDKKKIAWTKRIQETTTLKELIDVWNEFHTELSSEDPLLTKTLDDEALVGELERVTREHIAKVLVARGERDFKQFKPNRDLWYPEHIVIGNFSVFNSIGDYVLVDQHFPIIPIRDLNVRPETTVRLVDITCDSDGECSRFFRPAYDMILFTRDHRPLTMPTSQFNQGIPVGILGNVQGSCFVIALTGAYQDVIEMDHNLLGDLPDVQITVNDNGEWTLLWLEGAETMQEILREVGFDIETKYDPYMSD